MWSHTVLSTTEGELVAQGVLDMNSSARRSLLPLEPHTQWHRH